jgi:hypothetical protein
MRFRGMMLAITLAMTLLAGTANAEYRTHDGLFVRVGLGGGYAMDTAEDDSNSALGTAKYTADGGAGAFHVQAGFALNKNLIVHASLWDWVIVGPDLTIEVDGKEVTGSSTDDIKFFMIAFGGGVTYYTDSNAFLTINAGVADLTIKDGDDEIGKSKTGMAINVTGGKEWWIGEEFALGGGAFFGYSMIPDDGDYIWNGIAVGALITATFN